MDAPLARRILKWYRGSPIAARRSHVRGSADVAAIAARSRRQAGLPGAGDSPRSRARATTGPPGEAGAAGAPAPVDPRPGSPPWVMPDRAAPAEAGPPEQARRDPQQSVGPSSGASNAAASSDRAHEVPSSSPPLSSQHPDPSQGDPDASGSLAFEAPVVLKEDDRAGGRASGRWLSLRDAVRAVGSLERLYRLASEQKLPSRDGPEGQLEVWIADADRSAGASGRPVEAVSRDEALAGIRELASAVCDRILAGIEPLVANADKDLQRARETGALTERVTGLEEQVAGDPDRKSTRLNSSH